MIFKYGNVIVFMVMKSEFKIKVVFIDINLLLSGDNSVIGKVIVLFLMDDLWIFFVCVKIMKVKLRVFKVLFKLNVYDGVSGSFKII